MQARSVCTRRKRGISMSELSRRELLDLVSRTGIAGGSPRVRAITQRIVADLYETIDDLDIQPDEFWAGIAWLSRLGAAGQLGLVTAGLGFDRLLDIRADEADQSAGLEPGTPRAIEGPLYIPGAQLSQAEVRLDEGR